MRSRDPHIVARPERTEVEIQWRRVPDSFARELSIENRAVYCQMDSFERFIARSVAYRAKYGEAVELKERRV